MISSTLPASFDLVTIGERIEGGLKSGRIQSVAIIQTGEGESLRNDQKEEDDDVNAIWVTPQDPQAPPPMPYF